MCWLAATRPVTSQTKTKTKTDRVASSTVAGSKIASTPDPAAPKPVGAGSPPLVPRDVAPVPDEVRAAAAVEPCAPTLKFTFAAGSTALPDADADAVASFSSWVARRPSSQVIVEGHASADGSATRNLHLSHARATAGRKVLQTAGVPEQQIVVQAFGEYRPSVGTESRSEDDRRVVVRVAGARACPVGEGR